MASPARALPPLDLLRGFESAARHLSFTRAAAELFLTQSAISRQVQALESFLGVALFERRHKALILTEAGHAYYRTVAGVLEELRDATRKLRESRTGHVLTVTSTVSFASTWLVPRLGRFRKENPGLDVRVSATSEVMDLEREGIDLAIRDLPPDRVPEGAVHLAGEHLAAVCTPAYLAESKAAGRALARPGDLAQHVLINLHDPKGRWPWLSWAAWLESKGVPDLAPAGWLSYDQYDQVLQAALHGQGVAIGRMSVAQQFIRDKRLVMLFGRAQSVPRAIHVIFARGAAARPEALRFVEWLKAELRKD